MIRRLITALSAATLLISPAFAFTAGDIVVYTDTTGGKVQDSGVNIAIGVDTTGTNDSTSAVNTCLTASAGGTCLVPNGKIKLNGNISIPAATKLRCSGPMMDGQDTPGNYTSASALQLSSSATISAAGAGAGIEDCLIYRQGMTFPAANSSSYAGTAVSDAGNAGFFVVNTTIIGFDRAIQATGDRGYYRRVYMDGAGITHPVFDWNDGNTDSGFAEDIKIQPFGTGNGSCTASLRTSGIGLKNVGINFFRDIVVQNYGTQFDFAGGIAMASGTLWSDYLGPTCGYGSTIGFKFESGGELMGGNLNINATQTGVQFLSATSSFNPTSIDSIFVNLVGQDAIQVGGTGVVGGIINVGQISTNSANASGNAGRYLINMADSTAGSVLNVQTISAQGVNSNSAPYISSATASNVIGVQFNVGNITTNLSAGTSPYSGFTLGVGSGPSLRGIAASITSCTGSSVSCAFGTSADVNSGVVVLTVGGSSPTTGTVQLTFPLAHIRSCTFSAANNSGSWSSPKLIQTASSTTTATITWSDSALSTGTYNINYNCPTQ